jgi:hypothetical protein
MMNAYCQRAGKDLSEVRFMVGESDSLFVSVLWRGIDRHLFLADGTKLTPNQLVSDVSCFRLFSCSRSLAPFSRSLLTFRRSNLHSSISMKKMKKSLSMLHKKL